MKGVNRFLPVVVVLLVFAHYLQAATYEKIVISGETASHGIYDPSIEYTQDGNIGYMSYTACDNWPVFLHTHIAKTTDHGRTWNFVQRINTSTAEIVDVFGVTTTGAWHHETSTLVHDPDDPGREWKLYWLRYFARAPYNPATDNIWAYGWIGYKYASNPEGAWSAEIPLFGAGPFPPAPYSVQVDLNTLDPRLAGYIVHVEPGGLYSNNTLYLAFQSNTANPAEQILHLIKSTDHGVNWSFVAVLANSGTAAARGYEFYSAPGLVREAGRNFLFLCPGSDDVGARTHAGTDIVEFVNLDSGVLTLSGAGPALEIYQHLSPSFDTFNSGESEYDAFNTGGGIVYPQFQPTPPYEFQLYNTHQPLLHTPTPSPTVSPTPSPAMGTRRVLAFPIPASEYVRFQLNAPAGSAVDLRLFNISGELVATVTGPLDRYAMLHWNCQDLAPGVYLVVINLDGKPWDNLKISVVR